MLLDVYQHDIDKLKPFTDNGIVIDTGVMLDLVQGIIDTRFRRKKPSPTSDYALAISLLEFYNLIGQWNKFFITPHILTEVCRNMQSLFGTTPEYKRIILEILPILEPMGERQADKDNFMKLIDRKNPVLQAGDISVYVATEDIISSGQKIALLSKDGKLCGTYSQHPNVMVLDPKSMLSLVN